MHNIGGKMIDKIVTLKNGIKGKCIFQLVNGEYGLMYGKGGRIEYFNKKDILEAK